MVYKDLTFLINAKDMGTGAAFDRVAGSADKMQAGVSGAFGMMGVAVAGFALAAGAKAVKMAADFQQSSTRLVTDAGESGKALQKVQAGMLDVSAATGLSAQDTVKSMYLVESAGYHGAKGISVLKAVAEGSVIGMADANTVADALTTTMTDFGKAAGSPAHAMSELIATVSTGKTTMEALAGSLHSVLPAAASAGLGLNEVLAAVGTMTAEGISADQATQNLNHSILALQAPSQVQTKAMAGIGLSALNVAQNLGKRGLAGTYDVLLKAMSEHSHAGAVVVKSFADTAQASASMKTALAQMPPSLRAVSTEFQHGQLTSKQWMADLKQYPATTANLGRQFATLVRNSTGFSSALKSGSGPIRTTAAQLEAMLGGTTGLQVALHLTGDHMSTFVKNTKSVGAATTEAGGHVKGWADTQKNFNVVQAQFNAELGKFGIELGSTVLPALTDFTRNLIDGGHQWGDIFAATGRAVRQFNADFIGTFKNIGDGVQQFNHDFIGTWNGILGFLGGLGGQMVAAGQHIVDGLINGIGSKINDVVNTMHGLADTVMSVFTGHVKIQSPSKVFHQYGEWITQGLANGILGSTSQVATASSSLANVVRAAFKSGAIGSGREGSLLHLISGDSRALESISGQRAGLTTKLGNLKTARSGVYDTVKSSTFGAGDITGYAGAGDAVNGLRTLVAKSRTFTGDLKSLMKKGVSGVMLDQLVNGWNSNPDTALATANGLLANPTDLKQILSLERQLNTAAGSLGSVAAHGQYDSQIRATQGRIQVDTWRMQQLARSEASRVAGGLHVTVNLAGTYAGTKESLAKSLTQLLRDEVKKGTIPKNWANG